MNKPTISIRIEPRQTTTIAPPISTNREDMMKHAGSTPSSSFMSKETLQAISGIIKNECSDERLSDSQILERLINQDEQNEFLTKQDIAFARKQLGIKASDHR